MLEPEQLPPTARTDCTRRLGEFIPLMLDEEPEPAVLPLVEPDAVPVPEAEPLVEPVVPLAAPVPAVSALDPVDDPEVPIDELLDESSVPVTWTRWPTFFERSVLLLAAMRRYVVPDVLLPEAVLPLVDGDVLLEPDDDGEVLLPDDEVSPAVLLELPVVPEVELPVEEPIIALVSVYAPLEPCRHPVRVIVFEELELLWSYVEPEVPAVPDVPDCPLEVALDVPLVPDWDPVPAVEPDCAARLTAKAQAIATLDAVVTTRFMC